MTENKTMYGWNDSLGMSLYEKIRQDVKTAMLNKDTEVRDTMRLIMGEFPKLTVSMTLESGKKTTRVKTPEEITNEDLQNIIRSLAKSEKVVLELKKEETSNYYELLQKYLPKMAGDEDIIAWIKDNVDFSQFKNKMQAVGPVMKHFGKLADGNAVKDILKNLDV